MKTFKFRLYPRSSAQTQLLQAIEDSRIIYNALLDAKKKAWEKGKKKISQFDAQGIVTRVKKEKGITCSTFLLRFAKDRLFDAYNHFFKKHNKFPRFKGKHHYSSIGLYAGQYQLEKDRVYIPKIGWIRFRKHRAIEGTPKQIVVKKTPAGKWFLCIACEGKFSRKLPKTGKQAGIDLGLKDFAVLSDGNKIPRERFFQEEEENLAKAQQKLEKMKKGSSQRKKQRLVVAKIHERIANKRSNFAHQKSFQLVKDYDGIVAEDLSVKQMQEDKKKKYLHKSIQDVAWGQFLILLAYKALSAGKKVILVNPAYTSQTCSGCGYVQKMELKDRTYSCPQCLLVMDRDLNAAKNIYRSGAALL